MGTDEEEIASPSLSVVESRAGFPHYPLQNSRSFASIRGSIFLSWRSLGSFEIIKSSSHPCGSVPSVVPIFLFRNTRPGIAQRRRIYISASQLFSLSAFTPQPSSKPRWLSRVVRTQAHESSARGDRIHPVQKAGAGWLHRRPDWTSGAMGRWRPARSDPPER
jgi:hypothetical protein